MFDLDLVGASPGTAYAEREAPRPGILDRVADYLTSGARCAVRIRSARRTTLIDAVQEAGRDLQSMSDEALRDAAGLLRLRLRKEAFGEVAVARAFALVREAAGRTLGMRHYDVQLTGGWMLLKGLVAEMETGEGKTLTATLPACTAALAGIPVHVITVNDYLAARDADTMRPVYEMLGLSVGAITHEVEPGARRAVYGSDVTYCTNKELVFDYLRDRIVLGRNESRIQLAIEKLAGRGSRHTRLNLRGLYYAIVDEADSVLMDEARTPLVISAQGNTGQDRASLEAALEIASRLRETEHFRVELQQRAVELTAEGKRLLGEWAPSLPALFRGPRRREELVTQALSAMQLFHRDTHYLVQDDESVQIIDEFTGRVLADRKWEQGLHQMIEVKEGLQPSAQQSSVARITYQNFFRRYLWLAGMTGTAREVSKELWSVYRLATARVPTARPVRRRSTGEKILLHEDEKWAAIVARIAALHKNGQPVLVGTRSVAASEKLSGLLQAANLEHRLLNARQDEEEADIVAQAGQRGHITVATNMAGRGTDIKLGPDVAELGGLHVIATELHESERIDRQLFGRCGRQGDPGSFEAIVSLEDELIRTHLGESVVSRMVLLAGSGSQKSRRKLFDLAQWRAEKRNAAIRQQMLKHQDQLTDMLAFTGNRD